MSDFQKFTFSGHLRSHVYKVLSENIKLGHADYACYWTLELLCSGTIHSMWNTFFESAAHDINRAAPNAILYLVQKYEKFASYEGQYSILHMNDIRNNREVRDLVCEVAATLALCRKHKLPKLPRIKPDHDFQQLTIHENLKSPSANYARHLTKDQDPIDIYIAFNELVYCLRSDTRDQMRAYYWIAWMLKYASTYKKQNKELFMCGFRSNSYIDDKEGYHIIWMIWEAVMDAVKTSPQSGVLLPYIDGLFKLHCLRWNQTVLKSRICFLITAVQFLCESTTLDVHYSVPNDVMTVQHVIQNIPQWVSAIIQTQKTFA